MEQYLTIAEHKEYAQRMEDEHKRQNHRMDEFEKYISDNNKLLISVEKLAMSLENMQKELKDQGERLEGLESKDGEKWRAVVGYITTALVGAILGFVLKQIGIV